MKINKQSLYRSLISISVFVGCLLLHTSSVGQSANKTHILHLKNGNVIAVPNAKNWVDNVLAKNTQQNQQVILQFETLPTVAQRATLAASGVVLQDYIPDNAYVAVINAAGAKKIAADNMVYSIVPVQPEWKADNYVWQKVQENINVQVEVLVSFDKSISAADIRQYIQTAGGRIDNGLMEQYGDYKVIITAQQVKNMAAWYGVKYISPVSPIVPLDLEARPAVKANKAVLDATFGGYGLKGDSVTVGVGDNISGIYHVDLNDRIINYNPAALTNHGEHVNGIVGGAGNIDPLGEGMAPHVTLVDHLYDNVLFTTPLMYHDHNMTITNNSYTVIEASCSYSGTYDAYAQFVDQLQIDYPYVQHVFAAGNDGYLNCSPYAQGFATISGGYQPAKNDIVVTSITDQYDHASDGSRGPVKDGRLKPEISAIGLVQYSTIGVNQYEWAAGTSMASPQVAGGLALLTQRYKQLHGNQQPRTDILKAVLVNGAMDMGNAGPDYDYGFGGMDIARSLDMLDNNHYTTNTISNNDNQTINLTIPANTGQVKIMLYWHDVPASPMSTNQLVNDLDLSVTDPIANIHLPLVPDSTTANITNVATEKVDHLNNIEQITIKNPAAGNYTINVKGYNVTTASQPYVVAYDIMPVGIELTYPTLGEKFDNTDSFRVYWHASDDPNTFKVELSTNNGNSWVTNVNNREPFQRYLTVIDTGINSGNCLVRLTRNNTGQQVTSGRFIINRAPIVKLSDVQCPGYVNIHWSPVPNATAYEVYRKIGYYMQVVDTVTDTSYSFKGLPVNEPSFVSAGPIINGVSGYRGVAVTRTPYDGNCNDNNSLGDLMMDSIITPRSGRALTSTQLGNNETLSVKVRNLYGMACSNYTLSYRINGGLWQNFPGNTTIPANGTLIVNATGVDLSVAGTYKIDVAVHNLTLTDPVPQNDTISKTIVNINNDPVSLTTAFTDGFENMNVLSVSHDSFDVSPDKHWDYATSTDSGRLRSYVNDSITISGSRSVSMDAILNMPSGNQNYFTGTFNLNAYNANNAEVRMEFDYILHGTPKMSSGNELWVRGNDAAPWQVLYKYDTTVIPGSVNHSGTLSVSDALIRSTQNFSTSFQSRFGQFDTSLIATRNYGNGVTLDNFKIYTVQNDVALAGISAPGDAVCGLSNYVPVIVKVYNGVSQAQQNLKLYYQFDNGVIVADTLATIGGKDTVNFTFTQTINSVTPGVHTLNAWVIGAGDTYHENDSILNYQFHNEPLVTDYPYLENFEEGDGFWYTDGINDSWQYGTPASKRINKAASGSKAWKTNLIGYYNNNEHSYLYSPCFDLSQLAHPMLSFSTAMAIENCGGTLCDAGYMEYSYDGENWTKLGGAGQGTNWYDSSFNVWNNEDDVRWHVASIPLPQSANPIHLRFVLVADPGAAFDGIAVDDIHIYDFKYPIYNDGDVTVAENINSNQQTDLVNTQQIVASVKSQQAISNVSAEIYKHDVITNPGMTQYVFDRNYTVKADGDNFDTTSVRLFITDQEFLAVLNDTTCPSCSKLTDVYALGVTKYDNRNRDVENGLLTDNVGGSYTYYPYNTISWVPYDNGYFAMVKVRSFSEFWFNDGGPTGDFPAGVDYLSFDARRATNTTAYINWVSLIDTVVSKYELQQSLNDSLFSTISTLNAVHADSGYYNYTDTPSTVTGKTFYKLKYTLTDNRVFYSPVREVDWNNNAADNLISVYPNPNNDRRIHIKWTAAAGTIMKLTMSDIAGRRMISTSIAASEWNNISLLQLPDYAPGIYFLKLEIGSNKYVQKIVLE